MGRYRIILVIIFACSVLVLPRILGAQVQKQPLPRVVRYIGTLKNVDGSPRVGTIGVSFGIYADDKSTVPLWLEVQNVVVDADGHYTVLLGASRSEGLPDGLFATNDARWLGIRVENEAEQPRALLAAVPYALKAADAETLGGKPLSAFVLNETSAGSGGTSGSGETAHGAGSLGRIQPLSINPSSTGTQNYLAMWTDGLGTLGNSNVAQSGTNVGIGTTNPNAPFQVGPDFTLSGAWPTMGYNLYYNGGWKYATSHSGSLIQQDYANEGFSMYTAPAGNAGDPATILRALFIGGSGNVGVGTAAPNAPLQIGPDFTLSGAWPTMGFNLYYRDGWKYATTNSGSIVQQDYGNGGLNIAVAPSGTAGSAAAASSALFVAGTGKVGIGTTSPAEKLDVNGNINVSGTINASNLSATGTTTFSGTPSGTGVGQGTFYINPASANAGQTLFGVAVGGSQKMLVDAGGNVTAAGTLSGKSLALATTTDAATGVVSFSGNPVMHIYGTSNLFVGGSAGNFSMTGTENVGVGSSALRSNTTGSSNVAMGQGALQFSTTGSSNTAVGDGALEKTTTAGGNTAVGQQAMGNATGGMYNTAIGRSALTFNSAGTYNVAVGESALAANTTGSNNIAIGHGAGSLATTGSRNIYLGHPGVVAEANTIRIGDGTLQTDTYLTGTVHGNGSGLTSLNMANVMSGTLQVANGGTGAITSTGTGSVVLSGSPTLTGTLAVPTVNATTGYQVNGLNVYTFARVTYITTLGSSTYTVPAGVRALLVECVGGGGGGGGAAAAGIGASAAGGGGPGGYGRKFISSLAASYTVIVGSGGGGGASGANAGGIGGSTVWNSGLAGQMTCYGGYGGGAGFTWGAANTQIGGSTSNVTSGADIVSGGFGAPGLVLSASAAIGGNGASGMFGGGGCGNRGGAGCNASGYGAGGGGASSYSNGSAYAGGSGSQGIIIVWEFK